MASYGHLAVGLLAGRLHGGHDAAWELGAERRTSAGTLLFFAALAELPDVDVIGVACGLQDFGPCGHRGASHSLITAIALGLLSGALARGFGWPAVRTAVAATLAVASHGILDTIGAGGRGIPLLWPLSDARFMSPWRVLPDAPRGLQMMSGAGIFDLAVEFAVFFPLTAFALWPSRPARLRRRPTPARGVSVASVAAPRVLAAEPRQR